MLRPEKPDVMAVRCRDDLSGGYSLEGLRTAVDTASQNLPRRSIDEFDSARAREYALLATLLSHSPDAQLLADLAGLHVDTSPIGLAHAALAEAARRATEESVAREYVALFGGLGEAPCCRMPRTIWRTRCTAALWLGFGRHSNLLASRRRQSESSRKTMPAFSARSWRD